MITRTTTWIPVRLAHDTVQARERAPGMTDMMDLYGIGDHGGGPTRAMLDQGDHWSLPSMPAKVVPQMPFGTAWTYFTSVEQSVAPQSPTWNYQSIAKGYEPPAPVAGKIAIPTWKSELYFEYHRGVMTTQAQHKRSMRKSSEEVLNAEKWSSLAWLDGARYPGDALTEDWKKVLFNQFHDLAAGSGIGVIYKDAQKDYAWVRMSTDEISANALKTVDEQIDTRTARAIPVIVYNPLGWDRSGEVRVKVQARGSRITSATGAQIIETTTDPATGVSKVRLNVLNVPALGYRIVRLGSGKGAKTGEIGVEARDSGSSISLESGALRVSVDKQTGCITNLFDKKDNFESLAAGGVRKPASVLQRQRRRTTTRGISIRGLWMLRR